MAVAFECLWSWFGRAKPAVFINIRFTNVRLFTFRWLTGTQMLPTRLWFIALSPFIQPWLPKVPYARLTHQNKHRLCILNQLYLGEGRLHKWQLKALFAPQTRLCFHAWLFLGRVYTQECMHWLGIPHRTCPPPFPGMIHGVITELLHMHDIIRKWPMYNSSYTVCE